MRKNNFLERNTNLKKSNEKVREQKAITLIALVITIIVLLILASVSIAMLTGENGILTKASNAKEKHAISQAKEKVELAIQELMIEEQSKGNTLTKERLKGLEGRGNYEIGVESTESFPVEAVCDMYKFGIDENYRVTYIGKSNGTIVTYTAEPSGYTNQDSVTIKLKVKNAKGIKEIQCPDGTSKLQSNATETIIDYPVTKNGTYSFKIINSENEEEPKDIVIDKIDKLAPKDFTITAQATENGITITGSTEDADATEENAESGIDRYEYYVTDSSGTTTKYESNEITRLKSGTYSVYVIAYDRARNQKQSNTVASIKVVAVLKNITAEMIANKPSEYYGKTVTNYTSLNGQSDWKIFYSNGTNIFLITGDYIQNSKIDKTATGMSTDGTYRAWWENTPTMQTVTADTKTLFMATGYNLNSSKVSSKCASTLLNTNNWKRFLDDENGTEKAKASIGGATIEMWMKSWNNLYKNVDGELFCNNTNADGYYVGTTSSPKGDYIGVSVMSSKKGYQNKLYYPHTSVVLDGAFSCESYWLSSPDSANTYRIFSTKYDSLLSSNGVNNKVVVLRPVVALNSGITVDATD